MWSGLVVRSEHQHQDIIQIYKGGRVSRGTRVMMWTLIKAWLMIIFMYVLIIHFGEGKTLWWTADGHLLIHPSGLEKLPEVYLSSLVSLHHSVEGKWLINVSGASTSRDPTLPKYAAIPAGAVMQTDTPFPPAKTNQPHTTEKWQLYLYLL